MVKYYLDLLGTREHVRSFGRAIHAAVGPDDVVVDLGCGVGTYAIFAARAGARRVFGVDTSAAIEFARQMAERNGARVEFLRGHSNDIELPERATLLVFEDFSTDLLSGSAPAALDSVRSRWLAEGCRILPERVSLHAAPITSERVRRSVNPFPESVARPFGLDHSVLLEASRNTPQYTGGLDDATLLAEPAVLLDLPTSRSLPSSATFGGEFELSSAGDLDGLCVWNELIIRESDVYSNRPGGPATWGQLVLPTPEPWPAPAGGRLRFRLAFHSMFDEGLWKWSLALTDAAGSVLREATGDSFAGSSFRTSHGATFAPDEPVQLTPQAVLEARILALADGTRTPTAIVEALEGTSGVPERARLETLVQSLLEGRRRSR